MNNTRKVLLFVPSLLLTSLLLTSPRAFAQVPHLIRYQGQAVDRQHVPLEGPYALTFRLYDAATGGSVVWQETQNGVVLAGGHFSVLLGSVSPLDGMDWGLPRWLSAQVNGEPELTPRQQITSVPLAIRAQQLEGPITTSGNYVGIGTMGNRMPRALLDVGGTEPQIRITNVNYDDDTAREGAGLLFMGTQSATGDNLTSMAGIGAIKEQHWTADSATNDAALRFDTIRDGTSSEKMRIASSGHVGINIGSFTPTNILTIQQGSSTDPIADSWTVYPSDRAHKTALATVQATIGSHLSALKAMDLYSWRRKPLISDEEAAQAVKARRKIPRQAEPTAQELEAARQELATAKAALPKFAARRVGPMIDDPAVPSEILTLQEDGSPAGLDLLGYIGYLHAALKEAALKLDGLEARLAALEAQ